MAIRNERIGQYVEAKRLARRFLERPLSRQLPPAALALGLALGATSLVKYDRSGYSHAMLWLWSASLVLLAVFFASRSTAIPRIAALDFLAPAGLIAGLAPLYLVGLYRWPAQVSSDEVAVMQFSQQYASEKGVDLFGVSVFRAFPGLLFVAWGRMGNLLGGVDLFHMRLLEASVGLICVIAAYALFRQLLPRRWAICAAGLLGISHSFLMISRLAMRENTAVFFEVAALALLLWGLRHRHELATFAGGIVAGLGFYVYYPSRATFPIWILFLLAVAILYRKQFPLRLLARLGAVGTIGFVLMASPILISEHRAPPAETRPQREAFLIYPEGRQLQQQWFFAKSELAGMKLNWKWGLTTFNNNAVDHAWIYKNPGHGFVDPLTGILLWLGVGVVGVGLIRRRAGPEPLLLLAGFLVLWLSFAFVVNKAPNYTRLLVTLPFVTYLVTEALRWLAGRWRSIPRAAGAIAVVLVGVIAVWNLTIASDFIQDGKRTGDSIGSTGRYVTSHAGIPGIHFYMSADDSGNNNYYDWGNGGTPERLRMFVGNDDLVGDPVNPYDLRNFNAPPPFALFMRRTLWTTVATDLADRYPHGRLRNITPTGTHVVLEVPRS